MQRTLQTAVGLGVCVLAVVLALGAVDIRSEAGYAGVGPNFLPWVVAGGLAVCGVWLVWEARFGGFRAFEEPAGAPKAYWPGFAWVSAGILLNAALITTLGFILSCALCFLLAVRGFKGSQGKASSVPAGWLKDFLIGVAIAAPVYWMFTQGLAINLPGLTNTGWL
jgi:putative tricarboxylic transport membrane protein